MIKTGIVSADMYILKWYTCHQYIHWSDTCHQHIYRNDTCHQHLCWSDMCHQHLYWSASRMSLKSQSPVDVLQCDICLLVDDMVLEVAIVEVRIHGVSRHTKVECPRDVWNNALPTTHRVGGVAEEGSQSGRGSREGSKHVLLMTGQGLSGYCRYFRHLKHFAHTNQSRSQLRSQLAIYMFEMSSRLAG